jgi:hypothetical protein
MKNFKLLLAAAMMMLSLSACQTPTVSKNVLPVPTAPAQPLVGGDRDAHGCLGSGGYQWCEAKSKCLRIWEEPCYPEVTDLLKAAFAKKYNKPLSDISVSVSKATDKVASGGVGIGTAGVAAREGGGFLAAKVDGEWKIVFDGNGQIACKDLEPYDFPADMTTGICY